MDTRNRYAWHTMKTIAFPFFPSNHWSTMHDDDGRNQWRQSENENEKNTPTFRDSRKEFAYICNVSGLRVFSLICLLLICPTWKFSGTILSVRVNFYKFVCTLCLLRSVSLSIFFLFSPIMQRSAAKWESAEEHTFIHSHSTWFLCSFALRAKLLHITLE